MIEFAQVTGLDDGLIDRQSCEAPVHRDLVAPIEALRASARAAGFDLAVASGFRGFDRQLEIWNAKAEGRRPLLDDEGQLLDLARMSEEQLLFAILRWSALPGASRHHWGTDIDVYDAEPCRQGHRLQLTYEETQGNGAQTEFHRWLTQELGRIATGFFRPYQQWSGGVAPEPWHLSYGPVSARYQRALSRQALRDLIAGTDIALKDIILAKFDEIFERFVWVDWALYPSCPAE